MAVRQKVLNITIKIGTPLPYSQTAGFRKNPGLDQLPIIPSLWIGRTQPVPPAFHHRSTAIAAAVVENGDLTQRVALIMANLKATH